MRHARDLRPTRLTLAVGALVAVALGLRLFELGERAMHHDESLHATFSWYLAEGRGYRHDPLMHGPLQFHLIAALFKLFGSGEAMARLPAALAGTALVATPLLLRRYLHPAGVIAASLVFALSPVLLYFSRFARNDIPVVLFAVAAVVAVWRYREEGGLRWLLLLSAMLALSFASKETAYLTAAVLLVYLDVVLWLRLHARRARGVGRLGRGMSWARSLLLLPFAWVIAAGWRVTGRVRPALGLQSSMLPREGDLLVVVGTLALTQLAASVRIPLAAFDVALEGTRETVIGSITFAVLMVGAATVGMLWRPRWWLLIAGLFFVITLPLFTTGFTNPAGAVSGYWGSLDYWIEQQEVERGSQPAFYYFMMLPIYELWLILPLFVAVGWWLFGARHGRGDSLLGLSLWWFVATLAALSIAGEKMPWLVVHLVAPLGLVLGRLTTLVIDALRRSWPAAGTRRVGAAMAIAGAMIPGLVLATFAVRTGLNVSFAHPDTPIEPLIYTQSSPDVPRLAREIIGALEGSQGPDLVVVDTTSSLAWPWAWYLRGQQATYITASRIRDQDFEEGAILVLSGQTLSGSDPLRSSYGEAIPYTHRWWFPESGYRAITAGSLLEGVADGSLLSDWADFMLNRVDESALGALRGEVLFPLDTSEANERALDPM